jgi:DNA-binding GntR family transcriptional regulator
MPVAARIGSRTEDAHARLRADILACRHRPGERLRILDLAARFGVSHTVVREALSRLSADGLVVAVAQRGFTVAPVSREELVDLTDIRITIEREALRRSIARGDIAWESRVVASAHALARTAERASGDTVRLSDAWSNEHAIYHAALVSACESDVLLRLREGLFERSERYRRLSVPLADTDRDIEGEHQQLTQAVLDREFDRAGTLLEEHLRATTAVLLQAMFVEPVRESTYRSAFMTGVP